MFGKGQGALGSWIKELCQLIFLQTLQAFIFAIIISLIVTLMLANPDNSTAVDDETFRSSLGVISVFAMVSVFKVEDLARKIFGFGPTKADHGGAIKSIAKTAFALQLGKRVLDNGKKITSGFGKVVKSNKDAKKARKEYKEDMDDISNDMKGSLSNSFESDYGNSFRTGGNSGTSSGSGGSKNYNQRLRSLQRENEKRLKEIQAQRREGIKSMASGVLEFGGAIYGGAMGAVIGGADGNLDEAIQGLLSGAGLGDATGSAIVNVGDSAITFTNNRISGVKNMANTASNIRQNYTSNRDNGNGVYKSIKKSISKEINDTQYQIKKYSDEVDQLKKKLASVEAAND